MKKVLILLCAMLITAIGSIAKDEQAYFSDANIFYQKKEYNKALLNYKIIMEMGFESASLYYNIGNCYFKTDSNAKAILYYEKALKIEPLHENTLYNLKIANERIIDKIEAPPTLLISSWWKNMLFLFTADTWGKISNLLLALAFALFLVYYASKVYVIKKISFYFSITLLVIFAMFTIMSFSKHNNELQSKEAIVMINSIKVKSSPESDGKDIFTIHSGLKVTCLSKIDKWCEIKLPDNNVGWVPLASIEII